MVSGYSRATASVVDGGGATGKRGRGRPRKGESISGSVVAGGPGVQDDAQSVTKGEGSLVNGQAGTGRAGTGAEGADQDEEEEDDFGDVEGDWAEWEEREMKLLEILIRSFTPEQDARYSAFKRVKFKESILKRIVNQIVSQSVTKAPLIAINAYAKFFTGEIIERARDVQEEYALAYDKILEEKWNEHDKMEEEKKKKAGEQTKTETSAPAPVPATTPASAAPHVPTPLPSTEPGVNDDQKNDAGSEVNIKQEVSSPTDNSSTTINGASAIPNGVNGDNGANNINGAAHSSSPPIPSPDPTAEPSQTDPSSSTQSIPEAETATKKKLRPLPPPPHPLTTLSGFENPHRGGLLPDHLREALRRYRDDGEGGGVGFDGMSLPGLGNKGRKTWSRGGVFKGQGRGLFG